MAVLYRRLHRVRNCYVWCFHPGACGNGFPCCSRFRNEAKAAHAKEKVEKAAKKLVPEVPAKQ